MELVNNEYLKWFQDLRYPETDDNWPDEISDNEDSYDSSFLVTQERDSFPVKSLPNHYMTKVVRTRRSDFKSVIEVSGEEMDAFIPQSQIDLTPEWLASAVREQLIYHKDVSEEDRELLSKMKQQANQKLLKLESERTAWEYRVATQ